MHDGSQDCRMVSLSLSLYPVSLSLETTWTDERKLRYAAIRLTSKRARVEQPSLARIVLGLGLVVDCS
jgi:hypothetical protein